MRGADTRAKLFSLEVSSIPSAFVEGLYLLRLDRSSRNDRTCESSELSESEGLTHDRQAVDS